MSSRVLALVLLLACTAAFTSCGRSDPHPLAPRTTPAGSTGSPIGSSPSASGTPSGSASGTPSGSASVGTAPNVVLAVRDPRITEASGLARSPGFPGVLYVHNDKDSTEVFAIDATGTRAVLRLDVPSVDWEDIASTPDGRIWVGDIGDNNATRSEIAVHVFTEPDVLTDATLPSTTYRLRYPDGPHNAEALLVDPRSTRVYVVSKQETGAKIYAAPERLSATGLNALTPVQDAPAIISGGDFAPEGTGFVLRTYGRAFFYSALGAQPVAEPLPHEPQGEGITFTTDGTEVLLASEGVGSPILRAPVPAAVR